MRFPPNSTVVHSIKIKATILTQFRSQSNPNLVHIWHVSGTDVAQIPMHTQCCTYSSILFIKLAVTQDLHRLWHRNVTHILVHKWKLTKYSNNKVRFIWPMGLFAGLNYSRSQSTNKGWEKGWREERKYFWVLGDLTGPESSYSPKIFQ